MMFTNDSLQPMSNETENHLSCDQMLEKTFIILNSITGAIVVFGNAVVFLSIAFTSRLRQQKVNLFLASLAIADMIMGAFVAPGYATFCLGCRQYAVSNYCWLLEFPKDAVLAGSITNLFAISFDRYLAVFRPLQYENVMTRRRCVNILIAVWSVSVSTAVVRSTLYLTITGPEITAVNGVYNSILMAVVLVTPSVLVSIINIKIIIAIRVQGRQVAVMRNPQDVSEAENLEEIRAEASRKRKGTIACALVVTIFVVSWIPRISFNIQYLVSGDTHEIDTLLQKLSMFFLLMQSSVNPFIYSFYRADFRQAVARLLRLGN